MRVADLVQQGTTADLKLNLEKQANELTSLGVALHERSDLGYGCRVYPEIARSTAEQLRLLAKLVEEPIEITANICRSVFEMNVAFRYCLSSKDHLEAYADQAATDEISIYNSFKELRSEYTNPEHLIAVDQHLDQIKLLLKKHGRNLKPERTSTYQMAKEVGVAREYDCMYGIYSKYVHASAWFVLRNRCHIDLPIFRTVMQIHTQIYAGDTTYRLQVLQGIDETHTEIISGSPKSLH